MTWPAYALVERVGTQLASHSTSLVHILFSWCLSISLAFLCSVPLSSREISLPLQGKRQMPSISLGCLRWGKCTHHEGLGISRQMSTPWIEEILEFLVMIPDIPAPPNHFTLILLISQLNDLKKFQFVYTSTRWCREFFTVNSSCYLTLKRTANNEQNVNNRNLNLE